MEAQALRGVSYARVIVDDHREQARSHRFLCGLNDWWSTQTL